MKKSKSKKDYNANVLRTSGKFKAYGLSDVTFNARKDTTPSITDFDNDDELDRVAKFKQKYLSHRDQSDGQYV